MDGNIRTTHNEQPGCDALITGAILVVVKKGGEGSIQGSMTKKKGLTIFVNPLFFLVELVGIEPTTS